MALSATYGRRRQAGEIIDGSDLVGSIRIPAGFCIVYGWTPMAGIVWLTGYQPPRPRRSAA